jgi:hypothetical protein
VSSEGYVISNPKGNNRDLEIHFRGRNGSQKKFKTLRPGEACRCDKRLVTIMEKARPPRLQLLKNGQLVKDRKR